MDFPSRILVANSGTSGAAYHAGQQMQGLSKGASLDVFHVGQSSPGQILDELLGHALETQAELLIVGARKHSLASRAAMLAPCPVLMIPEESSLSFDNILIPIDFSESAARAARYGVALAKAASGDWQAVTVDSGEDAWLDWNPDRSRQLEQVREFLEIETKRPATGRCLVEPVLRHGADGPDVGATLVEVAGRERSGLIVMGSRGRTKSAAVLLGSVTEHVMRLAPCPVLAVKPMGSQLGFLKAVLAKVAHHEPAVAN